MGPGAVFWEDLVAAALVGRLLGAACGPDAARLVGALVVGALVVGFVAGGGPFGAVSGSLAAA